MSGLAGTLGLALGTGLFLSLLLLLIQKQLQARLVGALRHIDILDPTLAVEIVVAEDGHRLWINVDGQNVLRVQWMNNKPAIELSGNFQDHISLKD